MSELFFTRNPSMKFQNPILNFEYMDGQTDRWTNPNQYAPSTFQSSGGGGA